MSEETEQIVEHFEVAHREDNKIERGDGAENYKVWIDCVVTCGVPDFNVCNDDHHPVNVRASDPQTWRLTICVVYWLRAFQWMEANVVEEACLESTVGNPAPEPVLTEIQIYLNLNYYKSCTLTFNTNFKMIRITQ